MTPRRFFPPLAIAVSTLILVALLHRPLSSIEDQFTSLKYQFRGEQPADTNIVLVYIDNEAIKSFGWPPRRSFHALMVKALTDLHVKAIGIEVQFENQNNEYPEYDDLLASMVSSARNVVLTSYFREVIPAEERNVLSGKLSGSAGVSDVVLWGSELHLPFSKVRKAASGIGHVNLSGEADVPLFIDSDSGAVPAFGLELLRVFKGAARDQLLFSKNVITIPSETGKMELCGPASGVVRLYFPGKPRLFTSYPFLEVLKSYDASREGKQPVIPVTRLQGKVVLVGAIAEGISDFRKTPIDPRFPSLALHAVFLDNALRGGFLRSSSDWLVYLLCAAMGFGCSIAILFLPSSINRIVPFGAIVLITFVSFLLFANARYELPVAPFLMVGAVATISSLFYQHRFVRKQVDSLQAEKESIMSRLRDREAKLAVLERELLDFETAKSADRTNELLEEIRKYKMEIRTLSARADDMEEYRVGLDEVKEGTGEFEGIIFAEAGKMKPVIDFVAKIAGSDAPVLILGESGTGKELIARALHKRSNRADQPFVAVNCGALSESLLESELFGHERGAFTGAVKDKLGRFEVADRGTIFLDEIGEVSEGFQLRLLRVLQEGEFERVGGTKTVKVNVRVVAATNKDLKEAVRLGEFREDLYYRLNVLIVEIPPLRERQEDIPLLVNHFLKREGGAKLSKNVMEALRNYQFPGNVREMESAVKRGALLARAEKRTMITVQDLTEEISAALQGAVAVEQQILDAMREKGFSRSSISETASELGGLNRGTVAEYLRGECLRAFVETGFDLEVTVRHISLTPDSNVNDRVRKKLNEYLANIAEAVDTSQPWEVASASIKPKSKNLPQRYHGYLWKVAEAYFRGLWKASGPNSSA